MSSIVAAVIGIPMMVGIAWIVWYVWNNNRLLDARLANGDLELLDSTSYKVTEVIRAPAGSRVEKGRISTHEYRHVWICKADAA